MIKNICIYHKNCLDGFGAAMAVYLHHELRGESIELIPAQYGDETPSVDDETNVIIVDFSYPRRDLEALNLATRSLHVIDHHQSAQKELAGLPYCRFDMNKSGALMAWEMYMDTIPTPALIKHISDRDLWQFKMADTKAVTAALMTLPFDTDVWRNYIFDDIQPLIDKGEVILNYQESLVEKIVSSDEVFMTDIAGHVVPCVNTRHLISEIGHLICDGFAFAAMYFETDEKRVYSLRSNENGIDVSEIAKQFGGGGHRHAAGFSIKKPSVDLSA